MFYILIIYSIPSFGRIQEGSRKIQIYVFSRRTTRKQHEEQQQQNRHGIYICFVRFNFTNNKKSWRYCGIRRNVKSIKQRGIQVRDKTWGSTSTRRELVQLSCLNVNHSTLHGSFRLTLSTITSLYDILFIHLVTTSITEKYEN